MVERFDLEACLSRITKHHRVCNAYYDQARHGDELIWHYTSLAVFQKVIETIGKSEKEDSSKHFIRAYPLDQMNDHREGRWLSSYVAEQFREQAWMMQLILEHSKVNPYYATCFSSDGDLLSQWRAYADGSRGVAIGFKPSELLTATRHWQSRKLVKVDYTCHDTNLDNFLQEVAEAVNKIASHISQIQELGVWGG